MIFDVILGVMTPFIGTSLGAACVFFLRGGMSIRLRNALSGFAAGVMVAASFWSLLQPSLDQMEGMGRLSFIPAAVGFLIGVGFLLALDMIIPHMHLDNQQEGPKIGLKKTTKLILAVTIHNIPEGMAVGVVYAGWLSGETSITKMAALVLAIGIALQNFPEGAIISMPLRAEGMNKGKTFFYGVISGVVEVVAAALTIFVANHVVGLLPYFLSFAAGAMFYVVVEELIPEMSEGEHSNIGTLTFSFGFVLMMILDVALG